MIIAKARQMTTGGKARAQVWLGIWSTSTALWVGLEQVVQLAHDMVHELCHFHGAIHLHAANYCRLDGVFSFLLHGHVDVVVLLLLENL